MRMCSFVCIASASRCGAVASRAKGHGEHLENTHDSCDMWPTGCVLCFLNAYALCCDVRKDHGAHVLSPVTAGLYVRLTPHQSARAARSLTQSWRPVNDSAWSIPLSPVALTSSSSSSASFPSDDRIGSHLKKCPLAPRPVTSSAYLHPGRSSYQ